MPRTLDTGGRSALDQAMETIEQQDEMLKAIMAEPEQYGTIIGFDGDQPVVSTGGKTARVNKFEGECHVGDRFRLYPSGQLKEISQLGPTGATATLTRSLDEQRWEVESETGASVIIMKGGRLKGEPKVGDTVLLDSSGKVFLEIIPRGEGDQYGTTETGVTWDMIGGQKEAKEELREAITLLRGGNDLYRKYGIKPPKGIMLHGLPGNGKTMLGKAAATELAGDGPGAFMYVKGPEILSKYVGESERRIRGLFKAAREHKERTGQSSVMFIDEADAILQKRGSGKSSDVEKTIVPSFLTEMDGLDESACLVILATNRPDTLDEAVIRDGRIDRRIKVEQPGFDQLREIFTIYLQSLPVTTDQTTEILAEAGCETLFQPGAPFFDKVSGALVVGVVDRAKRRAMRREMGGGHAGLCRDDVTASIVEVIKELTA